MKINKHCFPNGLRLVHYEDTSTQMVALNIVYDVGARDEHPEHTGFALLFEHLMFGGSVHIPDYDTPLQLAGGENNAWTNNDITNYYLTVPKPNVETAFWLESDRMLELAFSEQSLEVQRGVVMEEFKQRCLNQPYGDVGHLFRPLAFRVHPYRWPTIGKELSHIEQATLDEVKNFFYRFYAPNNAVLAVTGNISWDETVRLTEKWFAPIPRRDVPARQLPQEPEQTRERRLTVERNVPLDALFMGYHMCSRESADYYAFDILSDILSNGRSSRLNRRLVQELGREPTMEEIAAELNMPVEKVIEASRTAADTLSLDTPVGDEEDTTIGSFVEDDTTPGPADATANALLAEALEEILGTLTQREADVLKMRFGIYDGRTHTLEEVGKTFGVTRERIRQIENKAIRKLRHPSRAKRIKDFYM